MKSTILFLLAASFAGIAVADDVQYNIRVDGITCPFCVATSERALKKIDGVHTVGADLEAGIIFVCADSQVSFSDTQLKQLFLDKGFTYRSHVKAQGCSFGDHVHSEDDLQNTPEDHADHEKIAG